MRLAIFISLALCLMSACALEKESLKGKRISIFELEDKLVIPASARSVVLPAARHNRDWPQIGGNAAHSLQHLVLDKESLRERWRVQTGDAGIAELPAAPIVAGGRIFVLNGRAQLHVFDARSGKRLWHQKFAPTGEKKGMPYEWSRLGFGGGIAYARGRIFAATGFGTAAAMDAETGKIIWREESRIPFRAAPVVDDGQVYFLSFNNRLTARDILTGREIWTHQGIRGSGSLLALSGVAVAQQMVITPYSSGEIYALRARNKAFVWADNLTRQGVLASSFDADFIAVPVVHRRSAYVISSAGYIGAINLANGERLWSQDISGVNMPWVSGNYLFVLARDGILFCLSADKGELVWQKKLSANISSSPVWHGPVLAGGALWLTSSNGYLLGVNPKNGGKIKQIKFAEGFATAPIVADRMIFLLSTDMELIAIGAPAPSKS